MDESRGAGRRAALGCLLVLVGLIVCGLVTAIAVDTLCYGALTQRVPMYPGAEVVLERHNLFRAFGMGETYVVLRSPDSPDVVSRWYGRTVGPYTREAIRSGDVGFRISRGQRAVTPAEDGMGSEIRLIGSCAQ